ncbi:hypothetical protein VTL71DRAFT_8094 [Oculimacula yallundae]|uniref:Uncharacterized protein n=1 Tax=Oculimacula yallundae TaxID=86028 RepID=A0ABR4CXU6_9HELO
MIPVTYSCFTLQKFGSGGWHSAAVFLPFNFMDGGRWMVDDGWWSGRKLSARFLTDRSQKTFFEHCNELEYCIPLRLLILTMLLATCLRRFAEKQSSLQAGPQRLMQGEKGLTEGRAEEDVVPSVRVRYGGEERKKRASNSKQHLNPNFNPLNTQNTLLHFHPNAHTPTPTPADQPPFWHHPQQPTYTTLSYFVLLTIAKSPAVSTQTFASALDNSRPHTIWMNRGRNLHRNIL